MPRKSGKPRPPRVLTTGFYMRIDPRDLDKLRAAADAWGVNLSEFVRAASLAAAENTVRNPPGPAGSASE